MVYQIDFPKQQAAEGGKAFQQIRREYAIT